MMIAYIKDIRGKSLPSLCLLALALIYSFIGITANFFKILAYTEDEMRHPGSWTK